MDNILNDICIPKEAIKLRLLFHYVANRNDKQRRII